MAYIAVRVYRRRKFRNLKNDALYREGRDRLDLDGNVVTDDGMLHAMHKRSRYGLELMQTSWLEHAFKTMEVLARAGADVPTAFARVLRNIEIMLDRDRVHGDLSAYNSLYWEGQITLIDFPQAINPHENHHAYRIFERDVARVCAYFAGQGVASEPGRIAAECGPPAITGPRRWLNRFSWTRRRRQTGRTGRTFAWTRGSSVEVRRWGRILPHLGKKVCFWMI